jgi:CHASE1-domain containing sensor protein
MSPIESPRLLRRRTVVVVIILTGTVLSFLSFRWLSQNDRARIEADFIRRADIRTALTAEVINNFEARLFGLRHLFIGSDHVTRTEFSLAAQDIIARYDGISALQWVPAVPQAARADIEALATQELGQPFEFTTRDPTGRLIRSPAISEHYPILYVEPLAGNEPALGYDLAFGPTTAELARARQTGRMAVSRIIQLVQDPAAGRSGVVFIWPVYHRTPHAEHFIGYVQGVFRLQDIFEESFKLQAGAALDALYLDPAETDPARRAFYYRPAAAAATPPPDEATFRQGLVLERRLALGDREWLVLYRPDSAAGCGPSAITFRCGGSSAA